MIITIDGAAATGKSTVAQRVAKRLNFTFLDTGALYRTLAHLILKNHVSSNQLEAFLLRCPFDYQMKEKEGTRRYYINSEEITTTIRSAEVTQRASLLAQNPLVRDFLIDAQRDYAKRDNLVAEGRDLGTVVFPTAFLKLFLTADAWTRAKRRHRESPENGSLEEIHQAILQRDAQDTDRQHAPLKAAEDSITLDTSSLTIEEVVNQIETLYQEKKG